MPSRSKAGHRKRFDGGHIETVPQGLFSPLLKSIANKMDAPAKQAIPKKRAYNATPENVVLEVRALYEFGGWSIRRIAERYGWAYQKASTMCQYVNMPNVKPVRADLPEWWYGDE